VLRSIAEALNLPAGTAGTTTEAAIRNDPDLGPEERETLENWNRTFQQTLGQPATVKLISPEQVIDQAYDVTGLILHAQRDYAKQTVAAGIAAAKQVRHGMPGSPDPQPRSHTKSQMVRASNTVAGPLCSVAVVIPGLDDDQLIVGRAVNEAVLIIDPAGPEPGQVAAQRFRFPCALKGGLPGLLN
jgi:hypothetical protein